MREINLFFFFFLGLYAFVQAQNAAQIDSITIQNKEGGEMIIRQNGESYTEEEYDDYYDEVVESEPITTPLREERGELFYEQRNLDSKFKDDYQGKKYDYDRIVKQKEKTYKEPPSFKFPTGIFQFLMYTLLALIVLLVLYYIIKNAGGFSFGNEKNRIKINTTAEESIENEEDISHHNFEQLIQKAKLDKDYRKAIRFYYLWVLQKLSDKNYIKYNKDKTDYDYFLELGQRPIKEDFSQNTYLYDYVWYGKFELNEHQFTMAESIFQRTIQKIT